MNHKLFVYPGNYWWPHCRTFAQCWPSLCLFLSACVITLQLCKQTLFIDAVDLPLIVLTLRLTYSERTQYEVFSEAGWFLLLDTRRWKQTPCLHRTHTTSPSIKVIVGYVIEGTFPKQRLYLGLGQNVQNACMNLMNLK